MSSTLKFGLRPSLPGQRKHFEVLRVVKTEEMFG
jgi:hypothetical protein